MMRVCKARVPRGQALDVPTGLWLPTALFSSLPATLQFAHGYHHDQEEYRCMQCEMTEERCDCEKYCCLCQSLMEIRLCEDGLYYCKPCREACDYKVSDSDSSSSF